MDGLVTFQHDLIEVWNIKPEMMVISEIQVSGAQLRFPSWCVVDGDYNHVQQSHTIGGRPHIRLLLFSQDNCPQYLFHGLIGSLRCTVILNLER